MAPKKGQKMSLGSFLGNSDFGTTGSWADDMPDLPTAPAPKDESMMDMRGGDFLSTRPDRGPVLPREDVPLPTRAPFTSFVGNLAFDAEDSDIRNLFQSDEHEIVQVKIINDRDGKPKGFGYVEFATVEGLKFALAKHGTTFSNRQIRVNVAEPQKEREGGFGGRGDDEKFASPWRRDGPLPARDDFASGGQRRRYDNMGGPGGAEPREPMASEGNSDWRSNRPPPRIPSEADMPPRRRGSGMSTPRHEESGAADTDEQWVRGAKFHPSPSVESQPPSKFGSTRGRPEGPPSAGSPVTPPQTDEGPWRRAKPAGSTSPTGSVPPTPQMGRRKLELLPRSASAQQSPLSSPKEKGASSARASPFGAAKPVDVRAREEAVAAKIAEREQHQPMSRTNSKQPRTRPAPTRAESDHHSVEDAESAPRSPTSGAASPTSVPARDPSVRPSFSFANAAALASGNDVPADSEPADVEAVTEKLAETAV